MFYSGLFNVHNSPENIDFSEVSQGSTCNRTRIQNSEISSASAGGGGFYTGPFYGGEEIDWLDENDLEVEVP